MPLIEPGRVCVVIKGADTGKKVVIKEVVNKNFVIITGEKVKERRSNLKHLEITSEKVKIIPKGKEIKIKEKKPEEKPKRKIRKKKEIKSSKKKEEKKAEE